MREPAPGDALFDLGSSSDESDVAAHEDSYVGEAIQAEALHGSRH
jgi:hypothetical protein